MIIGLQESILGLYSAAQAPYSAAQGLCSAAQAPYSAAQGLCSAAQAPYSGAQGPDMVYVWHMRHM